MTGFRFHRTPLAGLEAVAATSAHVFPRHSHDGYGIGFITAGGQLSASGRGQVEAGPGQVITVNPGEVHDGAPVGRIPRSWQMLYISPDRAKASVGELLSSTGRLEFEHPVFTDPGTRNLLGLLHRKLAQSGQPGDDAGWEEALILLLGKVLVPNPEPAAALPPALRRVRAQLDEDPASAVELAVLAEAAGLSRFQLIRAFHRHTGLTPHAYHMQRRASLCRQLLGQGIPPADVAALCGYVDQSHMHREFRRRYGITPGAYRRPSNGRNPVQDGRAAERA